jgi:hypothetical protein
VPPELVTNVSIAVPSDETECSPPPEIVLLGGPENGQSIAAGHGLIGDALSRGNNRGRHNSLTIQLKVSRRQNAERRRPPGQFDETQIDRTG